MVAFLIQSSFVTDAFRFFFFCVSKSVIGFFPPRSAAVGGVQRDSRSGSVLIWREPAVSSSVESGLRERGLVRKRLRI